MRPSKVYKHNKNKAYTQKRFIKKGVEKKLMKMTMGDTKKQDFPITIKLVAGESIQISEHCLESVRININRHLLAKIGRDKPEHYRLQVVPYPHHYVREHGLTGVAKGERLAKGMRASFGKITRRMARVNKGQAVLIVGLENKKDIPIVTQLLRIARCKLPKISTSYKVEIIRNG